MLNRLEMMRIFCTAAETGSFKAAAVKLGISPQAVTRAVQELEQLQGEMLFHRNTRRVQITAFGETLAARGRDTVRQLDGLFERDADNTDAELSGLVRITAPSALGRRLIVPALTHIAKANPHISFDLRFNDQLADVVNEKIDIGVRIGFLRDNRFVARLAAKVHFRIAATPGFIRKYGIPKTIEQLNDFPTSALFDRDTGRLWPWSFIGDQLLLPTGHRFVCDDGEAELSLVQAGLAYGQLPSFMADQQIAAGKLLPVLQEFAPEPWDLYIYRPQRGPVPARVRLVYDHLAAVLSA